jgi:ATP-binding cassette subfamily B (MDR/TAP) protein 1
MLEIKKIKKTFGKIEVLKGIDYNIEQGDKVAIIGPSGCGKSTVIALIQRFYDVERGSVKIDDVDLRELDIHWYRQQTALVSQEPVIYSGSIRDNILFGKQDANENEVVEAARSANAHDFIS